MSKMTIESSYLSIIALNIDELNSSFKRHIVAEWIKKKTVFNNMLPIRDSH